MVYKVILTYRPLRSALKSQVFYIVFYLKLGRCPNPQGLSTLDPFICSPQGQTAAKTLFFPLFRASIFSLISSQGKQSIIAPLLSVSLRFTLCFYLDNLSALFYFYIKIMYFGTQWLVLFILFLSFYEKFFD